MMKFNGSGSLLRHSLFVIRPARYARKQIWDRSTVPVDVRSSLLRPSISQGRRAFCGSVLNFFLTQIEVTDSKPLVEIRL
jgi:hypothetical protein